MKAVLTCALLLSFIPVAFPCANFTGSGTKYNGTWTTASGPRRAAWLNKLIKQSPKRDAEKMEADLRNATDFNDRSDYCVALMYLGRSKEAVERLQKLETERPQQYFIAANLGTALELSGDNEQALRWIKEGIRLNPHSHEGTEWLHVKILEAKIAQQKDADYFKKHSVLEIEPEKIAEGIKLGGKQMDGMELKKAIEHQLSERVQFVKPPDAPVASLLFDYAAIEAFTVTLESAERILNLAVEYGYPSDRVQPLIELYDRRIAWRRTKENVFFAVLGLAVIAFFYWLYKRGIFVLSAKDLKRPHRSFRLS